MSTGREEAQQPLPLFLHIGMHKTGSTSLQLRLYNDANNLKQRGVLYPLGRFQRFAFQHSSIVQLVSPQTRDELASLLRGIYEEAVASGCRKVILSGENMSLMQGPCIALLREAVLSAGFHPTVVIFSRPYLEWVRSIVSERMRARGEFVTPERLARLLEQIDEAEITTRFTSAFGSESLIRHELSAGEDCVALFEKDVGLPESPTPRRANSRIDFATLNWLNAVKTELDIPLGMARSAYDAAFERQPSLSTAEAAFLAEIAGGLSSAKGDLLKAELRRYTAGGALPPMAAQLDYLKRFNKFVTLLQRGMRRRAMKRKLRQQLPKIFHRAPGES